MFKKQAVGARARPELSLPATASESKIPNLYVIAASVVMLLGIGVGLFMFDGGQKPLDIPAVPTQLQAGVGDLSPEDPLGVAMASVTPAAGVAVFSPKAPAASAVVVKSGLPSAEDAKLPAKQLSRMSIKARENVWIEIRSKEGKALVSRILEPGDEYRVPDETGLVMDTGNAGAFDISVDGKLVPALGEKGDIKRKVALDPDAFLASSIAAAAGAAKKLPEGKSELLTTGEIEQAEDIAEIEDATPEPDVRNAAPVPAPATQQRKFKPRYINQ